MRKRQLTTNEGVRSGRVRKQGPRKRRETNRDSDRDREREREGERERKKRERKRAYLPG